MLPPAEQPIRVAEFARALHYRYVGVVRLDANTLRLTQRSERAISLIARTVVHSSDSTSRRPQAGSP
jgi:hypothetical protein